MEKITDISQLKVGDLIIIKNTFTNNGIVKAIEGNILYYWGYTELIEEIEEKSIYIGDFLKEGLITIYKC